MSAFPPKRRSTQRRPELLTKKLICAKSPELPAPPTFSRRLHQCISSYQRDLRLHPQANMGRTIPDRS